MKKFNVFDPILVRDGNNARWFADFYDHLDSKGHWCVTGVFVGDEDILPYNEETKHLHNTVGEFTKWEPKKGEPILVKDTNDEHWTVRIFLGMTNGYYVCTTWHNTNNHSSTTWDLAKPYTNPFEE